MRRLIAPLLLVLALAAPGADAAEDGFLAAIEDIPLAPGLVEIEEAGVMFETPQGRIAEARARGAPEAADVRRFYRTTLPQLGWRHLGGDAFRREGEILTVQAARHDGAETLVVFSIKPARP